MFSNAAMSRYESLFSEYPRFVICVTMNRIAAKPSNTKSPVEMSIVRVERMVRPTALRP